MKKSAKNIHAKRRQISWSGVAEGIAEFLELRKIKWRGGPYSGEKLGILECNYILFFGNIILYSNPNLGIVGFK